MSQANAQIEQREAYMYIRRYAPNSNFGIMLEPSRFHLLLKLCDPSVITSRHKFDETISIEYPDGFIQKYAKQGE